VILLWYPRGTTSLSWWGGLCTRLRKEEICWRELKLLAGSPKPDRPKVRGQTKSSPLVLQVGGCARFWGVVTGESPMHEVEKDIILDTRRRMGSGILLVNTWLLPQVVLYLFLTHWHMNLLLCSFTWMIINFVNLLKCFPYSFYRCVSKNVNYFDFIFESHLSVFLKIWSP
jgi:hypothetical protein